MMPASDTWSVINLLEPRAEHSVLGFGDYLSYRRRRKRFRQCNHRLKYYHHPTLIHVPGDYATIQEAINEASYNDTVLVAEDTYYENINFIGKPILVASEFILDGDTNHINNTIIDGSQPANPDIGSVVTFDIGRRYHFCFVRIYNYRRNRDLCIQAANLPELGGGVFIQYSGGKIINNHIEYNQCQVSRLGHWRRR